jgi:putative FmdB family regulatory protein
MPVYDYQCEKCGDIVEICHSMIDDTIRHCIKCDSQLKRVYSTPGIVFKGPGFYKTDTTKKPLDL